MYEFCLNVSIREMSSEKGPKWKEGEEKEYPTVSKERLHVRECEK